MQTNDRDRRDPQRENLAISMQKAVRLKGMRDRGVECDWNTNRNTDSAKFEPFDVRKTSDEY